MRPPIRLNAAKLERLKSEDPKLYAEATGWLRELDEIAESDPLQFYRPHAKQHVFHSACVPDDLLHVKAFLGGNQSGKTTAGANDNLIQAVDRDALPEHLKPYKRFDPPFKCRCFAPDFTNTMQEGVMEKLQEWVPKGQLLGGGWDSAYDKQNRKLRFRNGSWFDFLSYEQDLDKFGSVSLHRVHFDEEPPGEKGRKMYQQARVRVMALGGDIIFTMTPELGMSWMFDDIFELRDQPDMTVVVVATDENTFLNPAMVEAAYSRMSEEEQDAKRKGLFVHFGGLVLDIDPDRHVVPEPDRGHVAGLENYVIIDPGAAQGAVLWVGFDRDDVALAYDELYPAGKSETLVENVVGAIREVNALWGLEEPTYIIDPSARNRTVDGGEGAEAAYHALGVYPMRGKNDRFASVMQLRRRAAADPPGLLVSSKCQKLLWELRRWRVAEDERTQHDRPQRGQGRDSFATMGPDHLADCLRYAAMEWTWGPPTESPMRPAYMAGATPVASNWARFEPRKDTEHPPTGALT